MIVASSNYWNMAYGLEPGEIHGDAEGMQIMRVLGNNIANTLKKLQAGSKEFGDYKGEEKVFTNFIR